MAIIAARELGITVEQRPRDDDAHRQSAEHFRHRCLQRHRSEWRGGEECLRHFARAAAAVRREDAWRRTNGAAPTRDSLLPRTPFFDTARSPRQTLPFAEVVQRAYFARIESRGDRLLSTPDIHCDRAAGRGQPFHYFAVGAAVSEVEVDGFTGMTQCPRVDILHDVGDVDERRRQPRPDRRRLRARHGLADASKNCVWERRVDCSPHSPDTYKSRRSATRRAVFNVTFLHRRHAGQRHPRQQSRRRTAADAGASPCARRSAMRWLRSANRADRSRSPRPRRRGDLHGDPKSALAESVIRDP